MSSCSARLPSTLNPASSTLKYAGGVSSVASARPAMSTAARPLTSAPAAIQFTSRDRKSTRLNSSHGYTSYAVFSLKKKTFTDMCMLLGAALSGDCLEQGSMGVYWSDYDHSRRLSIFVTNFA